MKTEINELITINEGCKKLKMSRAKINKLVKLGFFNIEFKEGKKRLYYKEITKYLEENNIDAPKETDKRNKLNDLNGTEWLPETKSYTFQKGLGSSHKDAQIEKLHPAPFSFQDVSRLILFFTKRKAIVLDPFGGVGSTAKAAEITDRKCISIELSKKWHDLAIKRLETEVGKDTSGKHSFINNDCIDELRQMENNTIDFVVTSPPYWSILGKRADHKAINRVEENLETKYSEDSKDLGNIKNYKDFLNILVNDVFKECGRVIKKDKYMAIIVSDFRNKSEFISFHSDLIQSLNNLHLYDDYSLSLQGVKVLLQNHKSLLPYGYPFAYVENIHHQYILIFKKVKSKVNENEV